MATVFRFMGVPPRPAKLTSSRAKPNTQNSQNRAYRFPFREAALSLKLPANQTPQKIPLSNTPVVMVQIVTPYMNGSPKFRFRSRRTLLLVQAVHDRAK